MPAAANQVASKSRAAQGFTLIEMMAVMVLLGLLTAIALPNFARWYASTQERVKAGEMAVHLQKLYARVALFGENFELDAKSASTKLADGQVALALPEGWALAKDQHLTLRGSGFCDAASLELKSGQESVVLEVSAPHCEIGVRRGGAAK